MAELTGRDADNNLFYLDKTGAGTQPNPFRPKTTLYDAAGNEVDLAAMIAAIGNINDPSAGGNVSGTLLARLRQLQTRLTPQLTYISNSTPNPSGSDIVIAQASGQRVADSSDFVIRDTDAHEFVIPLAIAGYSEIAFYITVNTFDQPVDLAVCGRERQANFWFSRTTFQSMTLSSTGHMISISSHGVGANATPGGATSFNHRHYEVPTLRDLHPYVSLRFAAQVAPTAGLIDFIRIIRR